VRREFLIGPIAALVVWQLVVSLHVVNAFFLPQPADVAREIVRLVGRGDIFRDILATCLRVLAGFVIAVVVGVPVGLAMGSSRQLSDSLESVVDLLRSIPGTALIPLFILFFGVGDKTKIAIAAFAAALVIIVNSMYGVSQGSRIRRMAAKTMRVSPLRRFFQVTMPDALPDIFIGFRLGLSACVVLVVVSEMFLGTTVGLGHRIYDAELLYRIDEMYCGIIITGVFGYLLNRLSVLLERRVVHWAGR